MPGDVTRSVKRQGEKSETPRLLESRGVCLMNERTEPKGLPCRGGQPIGGEEHLVGLVRAELGTEDGVGVGGASGAFLTHGEFHGEASVAVGNGGHKVSDRIDLVAATTDVEFGRNSPQVVTRHGVECAEDD